MYLGHEQMSWIVEIIYAKQPAEFQLQYYIDKYGVLNVHSISPVISGNGFEHAIHTQNIGRAQKDIDCGNALICENNLIFTNNTHP